MVRHFDFIDERVIIKKSVVSISLINEVSRLIFLINKKYFIDNIEIFIKY